MLGSIAIDQGRPDAAVPDLMKALQYSPGQGERAHIAILLGLAHLRMGERQEAIVHLREALRISPGNQRAQELLRQAGGE
jgi:tetratricopeptide (TPR) repeat protein